MKKRKENESLEAIIKRKTTLATVIIAAMFLVVFIVIVVTYLARGISILITIIDALIIGLVLCWHTFLSYKLLKRAYEMQETFRLMKKQL